MRRGARLRTPVSILGLLPTLLEQAGLPHSGVVGRSLATFLRKGSEPPREPVFSEIAFGYQGWRDADRQVMVRDGEWKLSAFVPAGASADGALYNLRRDPAERVNLFSNEPQTVARLMGLIEQWERRRGRNPV